MDDYKQALAIIADLCLPIARNGDPMEYATHFAQMVLAKVPQELIPQPAELP